MSKILFVDDDLSMHKMVELFLRNLKCSLVCAKNGRSALKILDNDSFDLILSDIQMPEMDGITFLIEIRKKNKKIPFIILTAFGQESLARLALMNGASAILNKPFERKTLESVIKKFSS